MSLAHLQHWLLEDGIRDELDEITRQIVRLEIDNLQAEPDGSAVDWPRLILAGSILARSEQRADQEAALRIATGALALGMRQDIKDAGAVLLGKLSNFRAVALADRRDLLPEGLDARLGVALRIEAQRREMESSILVESSGRWLQVNEFQRRFWTEAKGQNWLSASAPTASGKTFLVLQWLIDQMRSGAANIAI